MKITRNRLRILFATAITLAGAAIAYFSIHRILAAHTLFVSPRPRDLGVAVVLILLGVSLYFEVGSDASNKKPWEDETGPSPTSRQNQSRPGERVQLERSATKMTLAEDAARWSVLVDERLATTEEVIRWADEQIGRSERPAPALIELATTPVDDVHQVIAQLRCLCPHIDRYEAFRCAAASLRSAIESGRMTAEDVATLTYRYLCGHARGLPPDLQPLYSADDEFYLAVTEQYGDRGTIERDFIAALKKVEKPNLPPEAIPPPREGSA